MTSRTLGMLLAPFNRLGYTAALPTSDRPRPAQAPSEPIRPVRPSWPRTPSLRATAGRSSHERVKVARQPLPDLHLGYLPLQGAQHRPHVRVARAQAEHSKATTVCDGDGRRLWIWGGGPEANGLAWRLSVTPQAVNPVTRCNVIRGRRIGSEPDSDWRSRMLSLVVGLAGLEPAPSSLSDPPGTAVRTAVPAGHGRPSELRLPGQSPHSYAFSCGRPNTTLRVSVMLVHGLPVASSVRTNDWLIRCGA
jgi:hypothetical protein